VLAVELLGCGRHHLSREIATDVANRGLLRRQLKIQLPNRCTEARFKWYCNR
jgi:hypothetical protein